MMLNAVCLVTADMGKAVEFWTACGLEQTDGGPDADHSTFVTDSGFRLMLDSATLIREINPGWTPPSGGHRVALALEFTSPSEVDDAYARLLESTTATPHSAPFDAFWGQRYATLHDPDGNPVDLYATL